MSHSSQSPMVGIDLGTTNSVVAIVVNGQPQVLDIDGQPSLPSVVGLTADNRLVTGVVARNQLAAFPDRTIASIKRKMGTTDSVSLADQTYTPAEISAMILRRLRDVASRALGQEVNRAVITVPAYFDENQRQATREAGELAGFSVERIINEPTAATLVYHAKTQDRKHIAVYDFGGGTFDVSIVRMEAGVTEVLSSQGDTALGGDDIDQLLLDYVAEQFLDQHGVDLRTDVQARYRVLQSCEQAKIRLSQSESTAISEEFILEKAGQALHLDVTIDRQTFNELIEPLVERTIDCIGKAFVATSMTIHQIDDLVLVGGSTRIPLVAEKLREQFFREPSRAVDPDLAVALGAAVQAASLQGESIGPVLVDVATHTVGIEACQGLSFAGPELTYVPIIHRNSPLPTRYEEAFSTLFDDQQQVVIRVLQGEHPDPQRNTLIGEFELKLKAGADQRKIVVRFDLTLDGLLRVTAQQPTSGRSKEFTIENSLSQLATQDRERVQSRLEQMFDDSAEILDPNELPLSEFHDEPRIDGTRVDAAHGGANAPNMDILAQARSTYPKAISLLDAAEKVAGRLQGEDADELATLRQEMIAAIENNNADAIDQLSASLDDLLFYVQ